MLIGSIKKSTNELREEKKSWLCGVYIRFEELNIRFTPKCLKYSTFMVIPKTWNSIMIYGTFRKVKIIPEFDA